jgi:hypothetical protein
MKLCPDCHELYPERELYYCRKDGARLVSVDDGEAPTRQFPAGGETQKLHGNGASGEGGVWKVSSEANWRDEDGELQVCLAQPKAVSVADILKDASRPASLALASAMFKRKNGAAPVARWFAEQPGVVLFPEYAFGSSDFSELNDLIQAFSSRVIVCAGFGMVRGDALRELLNSCTPTWHNGPDFLIASNYYNAGWCWVHEGPNRTQCYVFLKNFWTRASGYLCSQR